MELPDEIDVYFDGACEPVNPRGLATYGWQVCKSGSTEILTSGHGVAYKKGHDRATNNAAEYVALGKALRFLKDCEWKGKLRCFGDSQLVVNQVNGDNKINKPHLKELCERVLDLLHAISDDWSICKIPREKNGGADALSQLAYEEATGEKFPVRKK